MKKRKEKTADAEQGNVYVRVSLIFSLLDYIRAFFGKKISGGFFGKLLTSYSREQKAFEEGFLKHHFSNENRLKPYTRKIRYHISGALEGSWFVNACKRLTEKCLRIPLKMCGTGLFSFGIYTTLVYFIRLLVPGLEQSALSFALSGIGICVVSIPMMLSKDSVAAAVGNSVILRMLFSGAFGLRDECYEVSAYNHRIGGSILVFFGLFFGALTLFVHPLIIIGVFLLLIILAVIFATPEIGVICAVFFLPFFSIFEYPSMIFSLIILTVGVSYLLKLLRGKRILKMELMDLAVVTFALTLFLSGAISSGGTEGYYEVILCFVLMTGYFLVVNLMRTVAWLNRLIYTFVSSGTIVALIGVAQYVLGVFNETSWMDGRYFSDIRGRVTSVFDNPNVLGMYLCMVFPFALYVLSRCRQKNERFLCRVSVGLILLCAVLTWSRGAWLAILITGIVYALVSSKKAVRVLFFCIFSIPFLPMILPYSVINRFTSIVNLADSSLQYRLYTWKGSFRVLKDNLWGGIGYGNTAFQEIYPQYAYAGIEAAEHSHNLFLQIMVGMGIGGLLVFLTVVFLVYQMNLEHMKRSKDVQTKAIVLAALCSFTAILIMGIFDFVWYNYRVFFLFWMVLAVACAGTRVGNAEEQRRRFITNTSEYQATMDIDT